MAEEVALESLTDFVAKELREAILSRRLRPDDPIRQAKIAEQFGMSRIPVREALRRLESEGLVVITPNSGARVASLDYLECIEIYKIRERLEPLALSESIPHLNERQKAEIFDFGNKPFATTTDPAIWLDDDRHFHLATYAGVGTPRLVKMIDTFWNTTQHYRRLLLTTYTHEDYVIAAREHSLIAEATIAGNIRSAEELLRVHIERARLRLAREAALFGH